MTSLVLRNSLFKKPATSLPKNYKVIEFYFCLNIFFFYLSLLSIYGFGVGNGFNSLVFVSFMGMVTF